MQFPATKCRPSLRFFYTLCRPIFHRTLAILILYSLSLKLTPAYGPFGTLLKYRHTLLDTFRRRLVVLIAHSLSSTPALTHDSFYNFEVSSRSFIHPSSQARRLNHSLAIISSYLRVRSSWYASHYHHAGSRPFRHSFLLKTYRYLHSNIVPILKRGVIQSKYILQS
jgi:hypothetical protein